MRVDPFAVSWRNSRRPPFAAADGMGVAPGPTCRLGGFTVAESMIALFVFALAMTGVLAGLLHILRSESRQMMEMALVADAQRVTTFLRTTTRLSSIGEMLTYPTNGARMAISYPIPASTNAAGDAVIDAQGRPVWRETVVLHAWPHDEPTELRLTRFNPRDNSLSAAERFMQLEAVVLDGHGTHAANGTNSTTRVLSRLQPEFSFRTDGHSYNFYAPQDLRDANVVMGGIRLRAGANAIRFRSVDKTPASGGYGFRLDQLKLSPAGLPIEAEALNITAQIGAGAVVIENVAGSWSDRRALAFPASSAGAEIEFSFYNDTWHETLFLTPGSELDKCVTFMHTQSGSVGTRLRPSGRDLAWMAESQSGAPGAGETNHIALGAAVRVIVRGGRAVHGPHLLAAGDGCRVTFRSSNQPFRAFYILDAFISEAANHDDPGPDIDGSTTTRLRFGTPASQKNWVLLSNGGSEQTVPLNVPIDLLKSYVISYRVYPWQFSGWGFGSPWVWPLAGQNHRFDSYMIPGSSSPTEADTRAASWSGRGDLVAVPAILGVSEIQTTYADDATYTSRIVDTRLTTPNLQNIAWSATLPSADTTVAFKVRSGNQPDLSDAPPWSSLGHLTLSGAAIPAAAGNGRYIQVRVALNRDRVNDLIPELSHYTLRWLGEPAYVDFGGVFGRFANGGKVEVLVNGEPPASSLRADLSVRGDVPLGSGMSWALGIETSPRN